MLFFSFCFQYCLLTFYYQQFLNDGSLQVYFDLTWSLFVSFYLFMGKKRDAEVMPVLGRKTSDWELKREECSASWLEQSGMESHYC